MENNTGNDLAYSFDPKFSKNLNIRNVIQSQVVPSNYEDNDENKFHRTGNILN